MSLNLDSAIDLRSKWPYFRVLIIGRANAGKTTLLKKVCNSTEDPEIFSPEGEKIDRKIVEGSADRGLHDIKNQLIFKSNPQFIFHDSRGFESGSVDETKQVKAFIRRRAATSKLTKQLHAIWYCLPTDTNRPLLDADEQFFKTDVASKVPVIAIFTKLDGLITKAFTQLKDNEGFNRKEATERKLEKAQQMLSANFIQPLMSMTFRPSDYVQMKDMRAETSDCIELIEKTAKALSDDTLKLLFVSVQQNDMDLRIKYAVRSGLRHVDVRDIIRYIVAYFPHVWKKTEYGHSLQARAPNAARYVPNAERRAAAAAADNAADDDALAAFRRTVDTCVAMFNQHYPSPASLQTDSGRVEIIAAICICLEQTFTEASAQEEAFTAAFLAALNGYVGSTVHDKVNGETASFPLQDYAGEEVARKLVKIIKRHRLRIHPNTA